jgi:hypothetical protein
VSGNFHYHVVCHTCIDGDFIFTAIRELSQIWCPYCREEAYITKLKGLPEFNKKNVENDKPKTDSSSGFDYCTGLPL